MNISIEFEITNASELVLKHPYRTHLIFTRYKSQTEERDGEIQWLKYCINQKTNCKCPKIFDKDNTESWPAGAKFGNKLREMRFIVSRFTKLDSREISLNDILHNYKSSKNFLCRK